MSTQAVVARPATLGSVWDRTMTVLDQSLLVVENIASSAVHITEAAKLHAQNVETSARITANERAKLLIASLPTVN